MAQVERRVALATGVTLSYVEQGSPSRDAVICLPGWPDPWQSFELVLAELPDDIRGFAVSQRGCANSDRPPTGYEPRNLASDVVAFMEATSVEAAVLVGHSLGSVVAQRVAIDHPELVAGLVLIGSFATLQNTPVHDEISRAVADLADPIDPVFVRDFSTSAVAQQVPDAFFETIIAECLKAPARVWRAGLAGLLGTDHTIELPRITAPTLLLWGDQDELINRGMQDRLVTGIQGARLVVYAGVGHSPNWEAPSRVVADVLSLV